ncbi:MAG: hypothetical protein LBJ60_08890, partial [Tannerellaceae bacterium]|nr:hypothetical protein [Tannerellaceae bacterium]
KYFFIDINLPDAYITEAEQKLKTEAEAYYAQNSQPQVQYGLNIDENFIKQFAGDLTVVNLFGAGDYIPIQDEDMGIADQSVRITGFTRDLLRPYKYAITLGGSVTKSIYNRLIADQMIIDQIIEINNLADPSKARRNWRASQEVLSMVFDPEGDYYSEKIKPASIETNMLQVGAKSMQFVLQNVIFEPNYQSNPNYIRISGGSLVHYTIEETIRSWTFSAVEFSNLVSNTAYYIYARCQRNGNTGSILLDTTQRKVEYEATFYTFWIGVLNSVVTDDGGLRPARLISLTYGSTTINGRFIKTGRILSSGGSDTYFDLDNGEIGGKIVFKAGSSGYQNIIDAPDLSAYDEAVNYIDNVLPASIERLQAQIDDTIESWFYHYNPTLSNIPASDWTTSDDKEKHLDDTFTNLDTGQSWRFTKNSNNVYSWTLMADTAASEALVLAGKAQDTADGKRRVFTGTPYPPYDVGDLWVQGTSGDLMRCATSRLSGSYVASDWVKAVKYTDDTAASNAYSRASSALSAAEAASNAANSASSVAGSAQSAANMAARVFYNPSAPTSGMKTNDLWVNGSLIYRYNGSSWVNADKYDVQMTIVNGGLVSTGAIVFGQTGGMAATGSVRIWSGGSNGVVGSGTFRVLSTGAVYARNSVNIEDPNGRIVCGLSSDGTTDGSSLDNPGSIRIWAGGTSASSGKFRVTQYGYVFGVQFITNGLKGRMDDVGFQFGDYGDSNPYAYLHTNNNPLFRLRSNYTPFEVIYSGGLAGTAINITNTGDNGYFQLGFYRYSSESIARPTIRWTTPIYSNHLPNRTKRNVCWDESSGYMYVE